MANQSSEWARGILERQKIKCPTQEQLAGVPLPEWLYTAYAEVFRKEIGRMCDERSLGVLACEGLGIEDAKGRTPLHAILEAHPLSSTWSGKALVHEIATIATIAAAADLLKSA